MPSARTTLTEVATALGCSSLPNLDWAILQRPTVVGVLDSHWEQIDAELANETSYQLGRRAFENGLQFFSHPAALAGRSPRLVEWTGGRRPPGDEVVPADVRIDHVYLISCKYLSNIVLNTSPARLFDGLLSPSARAGGDWFLDVADCEFAAMLRATETYFGLQPTSEGRPTAERRAVLKAKHKAHEGPLPESIADCYAQLCHTVSQESASRWRTAIRSQRQAEALLWRMLRMTSAPYFVLGVSKSQGSMRLRIDTPWDWRQRFELRGMEVNADRAGQPQVRWIARIRDRVADQERLVEGRVEIRWSHGRFGAPPEAKVYLDTPHHEVPGYTPLV